MRFILLKIVVMAAVLVAMSLPFFPSKFRFSLASVSYNEEHRWRNILFVAESALLSSVLLCIASVLKQMYVRFFNLEFMRKLLDGVSARNNYMVQVIVILLANLIVCAVFFIAKKIFRDFLDRKFFEQENDKANREKTKKKKVGKSVTDQPDRSEKRLRLLRKKSVLVFDRKELSENGEIVVSDYSSVKEEAADSDKERKNTDSSEEEPKSIVEWLRFILKKAVGLFYIEQENYEYVKTGTFRWAKELKIFLLIISAIYLLACLLMMLPVCFPLPKESWLNKAALWLINNVYMYPTLSVVFLYEVLWFVDGKHKEPEKAEKLNVSVIGRNSGPTETDYEEIKSALLDKYSAKYNIKNFDASVMSGKSAYNIAEKNAAIQNIAKSIRSAKGFVNNDYIQSIEYMLDRKHVLFDSSLYSALGEYIVHYLLITLSFGKRVLFICKDKKEIENSISYLERSFRQITKTPCVFWRFGTSEKLHEGKNPDILFLTPEQFLGKNLFVDGKSFFEELTDVFVLDADKILNANNYYCLIMAKKLAGATQRDFVRRTNSGVRYRFFSNGHIQSVNNSLRQFFNLEDEPLESFHSFGLASKTDVFIWRTGLSSTLYVDNGANQVALEVQIAKDASNFGVPNISLISDTAVYSSQLNEIQGMTLNSCNLSEYPIGYVVVADDCFNLPNAIYNYSRFSGRKSSVLHVVSKPYLLRDYFISKAEDYVSHFELIGQTMSEHAEPTRASIIVLLCDAVNGIEKDEFVRRAKEFLVSSTDEVSDLEGCIKLCYKTAFNTDDDYEPRYNLKKIRNAEHEMKTYVYIKDSEKMFENLLESTGTVRIEYTNTQSFENTSVFKNEIVQHFIPGQAITRNNRSYTIKDVVVDRGVLILDDTGPSVNVPSEYIQTRLYSVNEAELAHRYGHDYRTKNNVVNHLGMYVYDADITVDTVGYYSVENAVQTVDLVKPNFAKYIHIGDDRTLSEKIRRNIKTKILAVELDMNEECTPHTTYLLSVILNEFMKTVFPHQYRCISVCPIFEDGVDEDAFFAEEAAIRDLYPRLSGDFLKSKLDSDFKEETGAKENEKSKEPNEKGKLRLAIIEDVQGGNGVVETLVDGNGIMVTNLLHTVADFLAWIRSSENSLCAYLRYGYEEIPSVFDVERLEHIVRQFRHEIERSELVRLYDKNTCFFCRCALNSEQSVQLEDNRIICEKCCESSVNTFEELDECFAEVISSIKAGTSVADTFPDDISVDFVSTEEIKKRFPQEKIVPLGFSNNVKRCIYVEYGLPRVSVYSVLSQMITEIWQDCNVLNNGDDLFEAQPVMVELQTLYALKKFPEAEAFEKLNETNEAFNELKKLLDENGSQDTFSYFLNVAGKKTHGKDSVQTDDEDDISFIAERDPASLPRFYFNLLNEDEKAIYNQLYNAINSFLPSTGALVKDIDDTRCTEILNMVIMDNPNIYWCCNPPAAISVESGGLVKNVIFKYCMSAAEVKRRNKKIEKAVKPFVTGIKESMSDYEVALLAHENIIKLIDYDSIGLDIQEKDSERHNKPDNLRSIYGVFVEEKAVCAGYARAYQYLLNRMGIECTYVKGQCLDGEWHAWNIVRLEGDYYYVDVTFDDRSNTDERKNSNAGISYDYFCITTEELLKSRNISKADLYPVCTATKCNYFVRSKNYFREYDAQQIGKNILSAIKAGKTEIALKAENEKVLSAITKRLVENRGIYDLLNSIDSNHTLNSYSYYINEELNILHILINR